MADEALRLAGEAQNGIVNAQRSELATIVAAGGTGRRTGPTRILRG
jgi:hypothetical protein